jgi:hypothetical protein
MAAFCAAARSSIAMPLSSRSTMKTVIVAPFDV